MGKLNSLKAKFAGTVNDIALSAYDAKQKVVSPVNKAMVYGMTAVMATAPFLMNANADGGLFGNAKGALINVFSGIVSIGNIVGIVCGAIALLFLIFSKNQRSVESAKEWLKRIVIGLIAINCLGWIWGMIDEITQGGNDGLPDGLKA